MKDGRFRNKAKQWLSSYAGPQNMLVARLETALETLKPKEAEVIRLRLGLDGDEKTFRSIGEQLGVCSERVRQIEGKALRKLRHPTRVKILIGSEK